jgi:hypothetical protein
MTNINNLQEPGSVIAQKPDYTSYVDYLESRGWVREQLSLDELNTNLVTLFGLALGATGVVIDVRAPAGQKISIMGTQQIPRGADARTAHALRIRLAGTTDVEINPYTKIRITKEKTSEAITQLARIFYADVNLTKQGAGTAFTSLQKTDLEWYRFKQGVELNGEQHLRVYVISPDINVDSAHIKFALDLDLWTREE